MLRSKKLLLAPLHLPTCLGRHVCLLKTLPHYIHRHVGGVAHVTGIKTVVTQLVHQQFVAVEIVRLLIGLHQTVNGKQER